MTAIVLSMGDPAGVGPELCARLHTVADLPPCLVVGDAGAMFRAAATLGLAVRSIAAPEAASHAPGVVQVLQAGAPLPDSLPFGRIEARAGRAAHEALVLGATLAREGRVRALVTAPLSREALQAAGLAHPNETAILAEAAGGADARVMLGHAAVRVVLATSDVPLSAVPALLTLPGALRTIRLAADIARRLGIAEPRIGVAALNPHAGEGGLFGREEIAVIQPAVERARAEGIDVSGPWPAEAVFLQARKGELDIVVAQYHDQGAIAFRCLGAGRGVTVRLGLPFVCTGVDHGAAFHIAGQGAADLGNIVEAVRLADLLAGP